MIPLLLMLVVLAVYLPFLPHSFVLFDDNIHLFAHPWLNPAQLPQLEAIWSTPYEGLYIPVSYTVWWGLTVMAGQLTGQAPQAALFPHWFHGANLLLHLINTVLVYSLLQQIFGKRQRPNLPFGPIIGTLLFALHPVQVESVAWASEFRGLLAGTFVLGTLMLYWKASARTTLLTSPWFWMASLGFGLALLAKPVSVMLPGLAFLLVTQRSWKTESFSTEHWKTWIHGIGKAFRISLQQHWPMLLGWTTCALGLMVITQQAQPVVHEVLQASVWWQRPFIAGDAIAFYLGKLIAPVELGIDYGRTPQAVVSSVWSYGLAVLPLIVGAALIGLDRKTPGLWWGYLLFLMSLLPVMGWVPFGFQAVSTVTDRYLYLPLFGIAWMVCHLVTQVTQTPKSSRRGWLIPVALMAFVVMISFQTLQQIRVWDNSLSLFQQTLKLNPNSHLAHYNLGRFYLQAQQANQAVQHAQQAVKLRPNHPQSHYNLGYSLTFLGHYEAANQAYLAAVALKPDSPEIYFNLANNLGRLGRYEEAIRYYEKVAQLRPNDPESRRMIQLLQQQLAQ